MDMHSMTYTLVFALIALAVLAIGYALVRRHGARAVAGDHTADPHAPRPDNFGASDRDRALEVADHEDPRKWERPGQGGDLTE